MITVERNERVVQLKINIPPVNVLDTKNCRELAEKLKEISIEKAGTRAGTLIQIFPCLASRKVDRHFGDAAIHIAGYIAKNSVEKAITS